MESNLQKINKLSILLSSLLLSSAVSAMEFEASVGVHDFMVSDIKNDVPADGISSGTSHTLGVNAAIYIKHETQNHIKFLAKAEAFLDHDKDHLDPDHIPVWFDFLLDIQGEMYTINENSLLKWYVLMDNRQNTVSCIEREIRQHIGVGYEYTKSGLTLDFNLYAGFYYIEIDDDTPGERKYSRQDTDDGEASNIIELKAQYNFNQDWSLYGGFKRYAANTGREHLEDNVELLLTYKNADFLTEGSTLNFKIKHVQYDFDRFYRSDIGVPILPFDNDTLIQAYVTLPISF
jgi:hypothetical protein